MLKSVLVSCLLASAAMVSAKPEAAGKPYMLMPRFNGTNPVGSNSTQGVPNNGTSADPGTSRRKGKTRKGKSRDGDDGQGNNKRKRDEVTVADRVLPPVNSTVPTNGTLPINGTLPVNGTGPGNSTGIFTTVRKGA